MKWIVEDLINKSENVNRIRKGLEFFNEEYLLVKIDRNNQLIVLDKELLIEIDGGNSLDIVNNFIKSNDVLVYGSKTLIELSNKMNIYPGSLSNDKFNLDIVANYLKEDFLNSDYKLQKLEDVILKDDEEIFIRPLENNKLLDGKVYNKNDLTKLKKVVSLKDVKFFTSSIKELKEEYRFFIVNDKIITYSSYKDIDNNINLYLPISDELLDYVNFIINKFCISNGYVLDIANTSSGYKVIEYNNLNASGLYNCNEYNIVDSLKNLN